jgi:hypothetical protein
MFEENQIIEFMLNGKKRYGVIDLVKEDVYLLWVNQIIYKGGYVCKYSDVKTNYGKMTIDEFRDAFPEFNI